MDSADHRWLSMAFTAAVIVNIVAAAYQKYTNSVGFLAVLPLAVLFFTGQYLFVLLHATKWRSGRGTQLNERPAALSDAAFRR